MSILDSAEFKKPFENTPLYATAALEVKKLEGTRKKLKNAKSTQEKKKGAEDHLSQITSSLVGMRKWEAAQDAAAKQVIVNKKVFKTIEEDRAAARKIFDKAEGELDKAAADKKQGATTWGMLTKVNIAIVDNMEPSLGKLETFVQYIQSLSADLKAGKVESEKLFKDAARGKELEKSLGVINDLKAAQTEIAKFAGPDQSAGVTKDNKDHIMKSLRDVNALIKRANDVKPQYLAAMLEIKNARKKLLDNTTGWLELAARAMEGIDALDKKIATANKTLDDAVVRVAKMNAYVDPQTTTVKANVALGKIDEIKKDSTWGVRGKTMLREDMGQIFDLQEKFDSRQQKLLATPSYKALSQDAKVAGKGKELTTTATRLQAAVASLKKKFAAIEPQMTAAQKYVEKILPYYQNFAAAQQLNA